MKQRMEVFVLEVKVKFRGAHKQHNSEGPVFFPVMVATAFYSLGFVMKKSFKT